MRVFKYTVPVDDQVHRIAMRPGAELLGVAVQAKVDEVVFWAWAPDSERETVTRAFTVVGTGHQVKALTPARRPVHRGVAMVPPYGRLVWHLLEVFE